MSAMTVLTEKGNAKLWAFIQDNGNDRVREAYAYEGKYAWLDSIDDDGHLEMQGRYTKSGCPAMIRFQGDDIRAA